MSDEFVDPLRDPRFPDRPQHPDFWRLSEQMLALDAKALDYGVEAALRGVVDEASAIYVAQQVSINAVNQVLGKANPFVSTAIASAFIQGLAVGIGFQRAGGHRPA